MYTRQSLIVAAACVVPMTLVNAQERGSSGWTEGVEEVIVTARKRQESFLDVPVVANVLTQETLERSKTDNIFAIATRVPGLLMGNGTASSGTQLSLRGIGTTALNSTMDNSVSLNIDGLTLTQGVAYSVGMFDVAQIEVLKGPQALFFGKNNTAGVISLRSADPTDQVEVIARAGYEVEAEEKLIEGILSGPVGDSLKLRLAARYSDQEGFFKNEAVAIPGLGGVTPRYKNYAPLEVLTIRGTALYEPNDWFSARVKLNYNDSQLTGAASPSQIAHCPDGTGGVPPLNIAFLAGEDCKANGVIHRPWLDPTIYSARLWNGGIPFENTAQTFGTIDLSFRLSSALTLNSVTAAFKNDYKSLFAGSTTSTTVNLGGQFDFEDRQVTQELRLTSDYDDSPINFMIGAFYQDGELRNKLELLGNPAVGLPLIVQHSLNVIDIRSASIFGQVMWDITEKLELAAGARWTDEERTHRAFNFNLAQGPLGLVSRPDPRISSTNTSPELTLTYKTTDALTAFVSYKSGFKSGSFSGLNYIPPSQLASFDDEEVRGGEVGLKFQTADRRLQGSIAAYLYRYDDLQVGAHELAGTGDGNYIVVLRTLNAASADVKGVEFDVHYSPDAIPGLSLTAAVNYNRARYDSFTNAPCGNGQTIAEGCNRQFNPTTGRYTAQDLSGRRLVRAPEWSGYVGFTQETPISATLNLGFGAGMNYTSEYSTTLVDLPGFEQESFIKADANVTLRSADDKWEVALIGRNITNKITIGRCANDNSQNGGVLGGQISGAVTGGPAGGDEASCFVERGREVWGRFSWRF